jgi:hypothetical protein
VFLRRDDGYADRYGLILNVLGPGPFEFGARSKLTVTATDVDGTTARLSAG